VDDWIDVRRKARACHRAVLVASGGKRHADDLIAGAKTSDDLEIEYFEPGSKFSEGVLGSLDRASRLINVAKGQEPSDQRVVIAHEIGHFHLPTDATSEVTVHAGDLSGDAVESGAGKVEGYSPRERKEVQADVFAGEFLCPADWVREQYVVHGRRPAKIALELGLPPRLVMAQTIRALLLPALSEPPSVPPPDNRRLDASQEEAATWSGSPLLVDAGPGTGKTRTLVGRIKHLLANGSLSGSILALTFSSKVTEEMRERLSALDPDAAIEMWVSTFHALGRELVTRWPATVDRTTEARVLGEEGSLALLEANLDKLPLNYYQNLYEPAFQLVHVLRAISRCKDEMITPAQYRVAAEEAQRLASLTGNADDEEKAARALEAAAIYEIYETLLHEADAVDFGDLILFAIKLIETNSDVQEHIRNFKHVLVDEYQDVNFVSARLLGAIRKHVPDIWVVADQRQSIYRFRGANPSNVKRFVAEFAGDRRALKSNYRSFAAVVRTFEQFAGVMGDRTTAGAWTPVRGMGGEVTLTVAPTVAAEAEAIRAKIDELGKRGIPYREQATLGRSHLTIARITGPLEQLGVPLLYLGDLFERDEVRDLLSLAGLDAEYGGVGLVRVAALPEYRVPRNDALMLLRWAQESETGIFDALLRAAEVDGLTNHGKAGLLTLGRQLKGLSKVSAWTLLTTWLLERSAYLTPLLATDNALSRQKLVAIYHLLKVCAQEMGDARRRTFLGRIRRIEALNQDTNYRSVAAEAADLDAVRVTTIHGSKGFEFGAVHVPGLVTRYLPASRTGSRTM
jgi:DNA helicase-2/ATP-dependent DNA helicase PcrA